MCLGKLCNKCHKVIDPVKNRFAHISFFLQAEFNSQMQLLDLTFNDFYHFRRSDNPTDFREVLYIARNH